VGRERSRGTGSLILKNAQEGLILTNAHLFDEGKQITEILITLPEKTYKGVLLAVDRTWDLAAVAIEAPNADPVPVLTSFPTVGENIWVAGYGGDTTRYRATKGQVLGYSAPKIGAPSQQLVVSVPSREGDSGGPMINQNGHLVGVLWGTTDTTTRGTAGERLRECVERFILPWNAQAAEEEAKRQAELEQSLISLIQENRGGVDPSLILRLDRLEQRIQAIQVQGESQTPFVATFGPPADPPPLDDPLVGPELALPPPIPSESIQPAPSSSKWVDMAWSIVGSWFYWVPGIGIAIWLGKKFGVTAIVAGTGARGVDQITDWIPGTWDDKLLDPLAYKVASYLGAKPPVTPSPVAVPPINPTSTPEGTK
jgi:hypothetical protein